MRSLLTPDFKGYSDEGIGFAEYIKNMICPAIDILIKDGYSKAEIGHVLLTEISLILGGKDECNS